MFLRKSSWLGGISAFERSILDKTEAKAAKKVVFQGHKIRAWAAWSLLAWADAKEAHEEPDEVKAPEETADDTASLEKETTTEAPTKKGSRPGLSDLEAGLMNLEPQRSL